MQIYLDTAPIIYLVENVSPYKDILVKQLSAPDTSLLISDLTRLECRVKPLRDGDQALLEDYDQFFNHAISQTISLSSEIIDLATDIRAQYGFATPDAIHLAAATITKCDTFLTNDQRLRAFDQLSISILTDRN